MAIILFDGACNLCDHSVQLIIRNDPEGYFRFASLQSPQAEETLAPFGRSATSFASIVLVDGEKLYERSDAALRIAGELRWPWTIGRFLLVVPRRIRDDVYDFIASNRYYVFGTREVCALPDPALAHRFL